VGLLKRQREILIGLILGDGYLQKTGRRNARLRLEHSEKQKDYIFWKYEQFRHLMQAPPHLVERWNPIWRRTYRYWRCQTHSTPVLGRYRRRFYADGRKRIPEDIDNLLKSPLSLAVWYMDDGYYSRRDRSACIYLPSYGPDELERLCQALQRNFDLRPKVVWKKGRYLCLYFPAGETRKLFALIGEHVIPAMRYKLPPNPVTTEGAKPEGPVLPTPSSTAESLQGQDAVLPDAGDVRDEDIVCPPEESGEW